MRRLFLAAVACVALIARANEVCVSAKGDFDAPDRCVVIASLKHVEVPPSAEARLFRFARDTGQDFTLGVQPANAKTVDLFLGGGILQLNLDGAKVRGWPVATKFELTRKGGPTWRWTLTAEQVTHVITIVLAPGDYTFALTADGHEFLKKDVTIGAGHPRSMSLVLRPTLRIAAHVLAPFPVMTEDCSRKLCEGDVHGDIRCEVPRSAKSICIEQLQFGRKRVIVDPRQTDLDLGNVTLTHGARVEVSAAPELELPAGTTVALLSKSHELERKTLERSAIFEDVDPGEYKLLVAGPEPLQRKVIPLKLAEMGEDGVTIQIAPYLLRGEVRFGDDALPNARIELMERDWKSLIHADDRGRFSAQMWDAAEFAALITGGKLADPFGQMKRVSESDSEWTIRIPDRAIRGVVRDAASGAPIAGADIGIESLGHDTHFSRVVQSGADGTYAIYGAVDGDHTLSAKAKDFCVGDPITIHLGDGDESGVVDFALMRGVTFDIAIIDAAGAPLGGALIVDGVTPDGSRPRRLLVADGDGHVRVPVPKGEDELIYVIPTSGSLASTLLSARDDVSRSSRIVVPPAAATLRIRARLTSGKPLAGARPRLRIDGRLIPDAVLQTYARVRGIAPATGADGELLLPGLPRGMYELTLDRRGSEWTRVSLLDGETTVVQEFSGDV